jgi:HSP20 family molecular chaperone IbpA
MNTRTILFDSPFLLGFDHTRALIDRAQRAAADSYPPYNVEQRGERSVRITLEARLEHGLLHVDMSRPEDLPVLRRIPITTG